MMEHSFSRQSYWAYKQDFCHKIPIQSAYRFSENNHDGNNTRQSYKRAFRWTQNEHINDFILEQLEPLCHGVDANLLPRNRKMYWPVRVLMSFCFWLLSSSQCNNGMKNSIGRENINKKTSKLDCFRRLFLPFSVNATITTGYSIQHNNFFECIIFCFIFANDAVKLLSGL